MKHIFSVIVGDWSGDGHDKRLEYSIQSNISKEDLTQSLPAIKEKLPITPWDFFSSYEEREIPKSYVAKLANLVLQNKTKHQKKLLDEVLLSLTEGLDFEGFLERREKWTNLSKRINLLRPIVLSEFKNDDKFKISTGDVDECVDGKITIGISTINPDLFSKLKDDNRLKELGVKVSYDDVTHCRKDMIYPSTHEGFLRAFGNGEVFQEDLISNLFDKVVEFVENLVDSELTYKIYDKEDFVKLGLLYFMIGNPKLKAEIVEYPILFKGGYGLFA